MWPCSSKILTPQDDVFLLWRKPCVIRVCVEAKSYNRLCSINIQPSITCVCKSTLSHITVKVNIPQPLQLLCKLLMKTLRHSLFTAFSGKVSRMFAPALVCRHATLKSTKEKKEVEVSPRVSFDKALHFLTKLSNNVSCFY